MRPLRDHHWPVVHHLVVERDSEALISDIIQATAVASWLERLQESSFDTLVLNPKARKQLSPNLVIGGAFVVVDLDRVPMMAGLPRRQLHQPLKLWVQLENGNERNVSQQRNVFNTTRFFFTLPPYTLLNSHAMRDFALDKSVALQRWGL